MRYLSKHVLPSCTSAFASLCTHAQNSFKLKYNNSSVYAGIEVGSKGVKLSVTEIGKNAQTRGTFNILKDVKNSRVGWVTISHHHTLS